MGKFLMSFSCGKDSTLALEKMMERGGTCMGLMVMVSDENQRSWFHGASEGLLRRYSKALELPLWCVLSRGEDYHLAMEKTLLKAKEMGCEQVCFGDIDIEGNRAWGEERCRNTGLEAVYPLWHSGREENVREILRRGYKCLIKSVNPRLLPEELVGQLLSEDVLKTMAARGVDLCGENGEYHTLVVDGSIFRRKLDYRAGRILRGEHHVSLEVLEGD